MVKKRMMIQFWRLQQTQQIIGLFFWALTLTGVFYLSYFHSWFVKFGVVRNDEVFLGTIITFFLIILAFLVIGLIYDRVLKLWVEQTDVTVERNPYSTGYLLPKEIVYWRRTTLPVMKALAKSDGAVQKDIDFVEKWIAASLAKQHDLQAYVDKLEKWIAE